MGWSEVNRPTGPSARGLPQRWAAPAIASRTLRPDAVAPASHPVIVRAMPTQIITSVALSRSRSMVLTTDVTTASNSDGACATISASPRYRAASIRAPPIVRPIPVHRTPRARGRQSRMPTTNMIRTTAQSQLATGRKMRSALAAVCRFGVSASTTSRPGTSRESTNGTPRAASSVVTFSTAILVSRMIWPSWRVTAASEVSRLRTLTNCSWSRVEMANHPSPKRSLWV